MKGVVFVFLCGFGAWISAAEGQIKANSGEGGRDAPADRLSVLTGEPLDIAVLRRAVTLDGVLAEGEWADATHISGALDLFEGRPSSRRVDFWVKHGGHALYIAQRSRLKPRSPHPFWFRDGDDNSVVVALAPGGVNQGDTPSHYVLRFNPQGQRIGWEITDQYRDVKLRWPHLPWQNSVAAADPDLPYGYGFRDSEAGEDPEGAAPVRMASHVDASSGIWTTEMVIPFAAMNVEAPSSGQQWGLLLARDYPGVEQTAIVHADDWRHGTANRVRGVGFYNLYRNADDYLPIRFAPDAKPARMIVATVDEDADDAPALPMAYFSGYHRVDTHNQTRSSESLSVYHPIRNEIFVRTRLGSVNRGMDARRMAVSVRRQGERVPLMTHTVTNDAAPWIGLRMNPGPHVRPMGIVLEWVAPEDGVAHVDYRMANIRVPLAEPGEDATALQRAHYRASIDGGHARLIQVPAAGGTPREWVARTRFAAYREWVPIRAEDIVVAAGDRLQLYVGVQGVSFKDNLMSGSIRFEDKHGQRRIYSPVDERDGGQGGTSGVWRYRYDQDTTPNPDGVYADMTYDAERGTWQAFHDDPAHASRPAVGIAKTAIEAERTIRFTLPELEPGIYAAELEVFDAAGVLLGGNRELFVRYDHAQDLPWLGAGVGVSDTILPGWQALKTRLDEDSLQFVVTGRTLHVTGAGLPERITVGATDLLAAPMRLDIVRDGVRVGLRPQSAPRAVARQADHAVYAGGLQGSGWQVDVQGHIEYDGFIWFDVTLAPDGEQTVDAVRLEIPLRADVATYLHAAGGIWMRDAVSAIILPEKEGVLWDSSRSRRPYNGRGLTVGNFLPYIWIGNDVHGLAFMADSDEGWVPDPAKENSAQVVTRHDDQVVLALNLVARPFTFNGPRRMGFGLQATPVKDLPDDFRGRMSRLSLNVAFPGFDPAGNGWDWNGQMLRLPDGRRSLVSGHGSNPYPLNWALSRRRGASNPRSPFATADEMQPVRDPGSEGYVRGLRGAANLPYQALNAILQPAELEHPLVEGIHGANFYGYLGPAVVSDREWGDANIAAPDADYRLWHYRHWIRNSYLDGLYFDNTFPTLDGLSSGYDLDLPDSPDLHGKRQPGYALRNQREFFKRLRTLFIDEGIDPVIWLHATDAFVLPAFAFADVLMDGEHFPGLTPQRPWSSEKWPIHPSHMRTLTGSRKWGLAVYYLPMIRTFRTQDQDLWHQVYRNLDGYYALFDCLTEVRWPIFGMDLDVAAAFYPYWGEVIAQGAVCQEEGVQISAWKQGEQLYVLVFNFSEQAHEPARLLIRPAAFGLEGADWSVRDLEPDGDALNKTLWDRRRVENYNERYRGASLGFALDAGALVVGVPILPRNYRVMVIEPTKAGN